MTYDLNARNYAMQALAKIERLEAILKIAGITPSEVEISAEIADSRKKKARIDKIQNRKEWLRNADRWVVEHWRTDFKKNYRRFRAEKRAERQTEDAQ